MRVRHTNINMLQDVNSMKKMRKRDEERKNKKAREKMTLRSCVFRSRVNTYKEPVLFCVYVFLSSISLSVERELYNRIEAF